LAQSIAPLYSLGPEDGWVCSRTWKIRSSVIKRQSGSQVGKECRYLDDIKGLTGQYLGYAADGAGCDILCSSDDSFIFFGGHAHNAKKGSGGWKISNRVPPPGPLLQQRPAIARLCKLRLHFPSAPPVTDAQDRDATEKPQSADTVYTARINKSIASRYNIVSQPCNCNESLAEVNVLRRHVARIHRHARASRIQHGTPSNGRQRRQGHRFTRTMAAFSSPTLFGRDPRRRPMQG